MSLLRIESLQYHDYGPFSFEIKSKECICLSGPSGSGKTLMLRAIADLDPHFGKVFLDQDECFALSGPEWRKKVGLLPAISQWWYPTVGEHFLQTESSWFHHLALELDVLKWNVSRLSTGERQRLALLRLLCNNKPAVLLLDEPTASLDQKNTERVEHCIQDFSQQFQAPILWVSHDLEQIKRVAQKHFLFQDGILKEQEDQ